MGKFDRNPDISPAYHDLFAEWLCANHGQNRKPKEESEAGDLAEMGDMAEVGGTTEIDQVAGTGTGTGTGTGEAEEDSAATEPSESRLCHSSSGADPDLSSLTSDGEDDQSEKDIVSDTESDYFAEVSRVPFPSMNFKPDFVFRRRG